MEYTVWIAISGKAKNALKYRGIEPRSLVFINIAMQVACRPFGESEIDIYRLIIEKTEFAFVRDLQERHMLVVKSKEVRGEDEKSLRSLMKRRHYEIGLTVRR